MTSTQPIGSGRFSFSALPLILIFIVASIAMGTSVHLSVSFADFAFTSWVTLSMVIPISINGCGLREGVLVTFLTAVGVSPERALAFSLLYGACNVIPSLPGLPMWWLNDDRT